ncbi:hypothetical protein [Halobacillus seohaensis]|uniref:YtxH domain-containing protein n=1 Tax=Halobacillus seohaensis TaxID=447421 RepID=A0ABW2EHF2_9BACI
MNNRRSMMTSLLALGATGAAVYGITRGVRNGTFQQIPEMVSNGLNNQQDQKMANPLEEMANNEALQQIVPNQNDQ